MSARFLSAASFKSAANLAPSSASVFAGRSGRRPPVSNLRMPKYAMMSSRMTESAPLTNERMVRRVIGAPLLDNAIRAQEQRPRNCETERIRCLEVDDEFEFR